MKRIALLMLLLSSVCHGQVAIIEKTNDLKSDLERLVNTEGNKVVHIVGGKHVLTEPIFLHSFEVEIYGHDATIVKDLGKFKRRPLLYNLCNSCVISGITFDINRTDEWIDYNTILGLNPPEWLSSHYGWTGPTDVYRHKFTIQNCRFIDSKDKRKPQGRRDNWCIVSNTTLPMNNFTFAGNVVDIKDCEATGGTWGAENVLFDNNHIWGGKTTGGLLSLLSRYQGESQRFVRNVKITNNTFHNVHRLAISLGFDSSHARALTYDTILIEGNVSSLSPDSDEFSRLVTIKFRDFNGKMVVRNNWIDARAVSPDVEIRPRDITAKNQGKPGGTIIYRASTYMMPQGAGFSFVNNIRSREFGKVVELK